MIDAVGVSYAPADAHVLVRRRVDYVVSRAGGEGAAREVAEHVLLRSGLSLDDAYRPLLDEWARHAVVQ
ncbi:3-deoxy-manno-octulosonate-8-phosphatase [Burkholderia pseudomallei]|nr:3-deoxy-manno-octulosonate-8-phosphatase [Burkholderia pseudomallei]